MEDIPKPDLIGDAEHATTSKAAPDVFGDIDKRLGLLLDRANKLESTLNRLNDKCDKNNSGNDSDLDLISSEEIDDDYSFEVDDLDLDADGNDSDAGDVADNVEKIDLNAHED